MWSINLLWFLFSHLGSMAVPLSCFDANYAPTDFQVSSHGAIYRQARHGSPLPQPELVADLSNSGWLFSASHRVAVSHLPQSFAAGQQGFEQLILLAYDPQTQTEQLLVVRVFPYQPSIWQFDQLLPYIDDETLLAGESVVSALWQQQQQAAGWWRPLPGPAVQLPQLYGGVLYLPVANAANYPECPEYPLDLSVKIIHMHSGHTIAPQIDVELAQPGSLQWRLQKHGEQLSLWLEQQEQSWQLQPQLQQILDDCLQCTEIIHYNTWPKRVALAHFWLEEGAY